MPLVVATISEYNIRSIDIKIKRSINMKRKMNKVHFIKIKKMLSKDIMKS